MDAGGGDHPDRIGGGHLCRYFFLLRAFQFSPE
jgi:hypothetical protein